MVSYESEGKDTGRARDTCIIFQSPNGKCPVLQHPARICFQWTGSSTASKTRTCLPEHWDHSHATVKKEASRGQKSISRSMPSYYLCTVRHPRTALYRIAHTAPYCGTLCTDALLHQSCSWPRSTKILSEGNGRTHKLSAALGCRA